MLQLIENNFSNALRLTDGELEKIILNSLGIKSVINRNEDKLYIAINSYQSCFTLMQKLRWDFDYSVHKKGEIYIIDINNIDDYYYSEHKQEIKNKKLWKK